MKKLILFLVLVLFSFSAYSQDVIMTNEKHELLRKDIENYKKLIITHKKIVRENKTLKDSIAVLNYQIKLLNENCNKTPQKKKFFKRMQDKLNKFRRKLKPHKQKQDW
jgi:cell division protein FtsB